MNQIVEPKDFKNDLPFDLIDGLNLAYGIIEKSTIQKLISNLIVKSITTMSNCSMKYKNLE